MVLKININVKGQRISELIAKLFKYLFVYSSTVLTGSTISISIKKNFAALAGLSALLLSSLQPSAGQTSGTGTTTADACTTAVGQLLTDCLKPAGILQQNFLWFVSNATSPSGQVPADPAAFKTQVCA
jgi:hypothetical protein